MGKPSGVGRHLIGAIAGAGLLLGSLQAAALPTEYSFSFSMDSGAILAGSFLGEDLDAPQDDLISYGSHAPGNVDTVQNFSMTYSSGGANPALDAVSWSQAEGDFFTLIWDTLSNNLVGIMAQDWFVDATGADGSFYNIFIGEATPGPRYARIDDDQGANGRVLDFRIDSPIPAPATLSLFGLGLLGLALGRRRANSRSRS